MESSVTNTISSTRRLSDGHSIEFTLEKPLADEDRRAWLESPPTVQRGEEQHPPSLIHASGPSTILCTWDFQLGPREMVAA